MLFQITITAAAAAFCGATAVVSQPVPHGAVDASYAALHPHKDKAYHSQVLAADAKAVLGEPCTDGSSTSC
ncbi:hypothetical protein C2857_004849 [Epichloe festucae Fl1]|uniref:Uncharacterized protein n=1 Tax=Epichloe festucae (strain Fl1) TaxID=877507 RepID=A0A7U3SNQ3_EPIFF|nr:hypothetical protein C2857_004849 [Epichloe festucae Fl1]